jgi:predicted dehydrogenase
MRAAIAKAGVKSVSSVVLRWNPQFETVKALLNEGKLGKLIYAEADYWHPIVKAYSGYPQGKRILIEQAGEHGL